MAVLEGSLFSESLRMNTALFVILPDGSKRLDEDGDLPVLYLLHGLSDNHANWVYNTGIVRYAQSAGIAVVMPEVQRSFYCDMAYGLRYYQYVAEELPAACHRLFRVTDRPAGSYVAGLSMGGYGALKLALRSPGRFAAAGSFSGAVDIKARLEDPAAQTPETYGVNGGRLSAEDDLFLLTAKAAKEHVATPALYITCGLSDFLHEDNQRFCRQLDFLRIPYVYEEWAGGHEWAFWDRSVKQFLQFIGS